MVSTIASLDLYQGYAANVIRLGVHRLWCDETINEVIGVDERYVAVRGYKSLFVFDHRTGELVTGVDARSITGVAHPAVGKLHMAKASLDGRFVAAASFGNRVRVLEGGVMKFADDPEYAYDAVTFARDGRVVATADSAHVWTIG